MRVTRVRVAGVCLVLGGLLAASLWLALGAGAVPLDGRTLGLWLTGGLHDPQAEAILLHFRLPRVLLAGLAGAGLALAGLALQTVLQNPLAEPFIMGVSGGAALGAVLALAGGVPGLAARGGAAFAGAAASALMVLALARRQGRADPAALVLVGVMVNAFCAAVIMFILSTTSDQKLHAIMFWLYGDLGGASLEQAAWLASVVAGGGLWLWLRSRELNLLVSGETTAAALGVEVERIRLQVLAISSLMAGLIVCLSGLIGFVGLMLPHLARLALGHDHRLVLPAAGLGGAVFLVLADAVARVLISPAVLPVGVVTAMLGVPFFLVLLLQRRRQWW